MKSRILTTLFSAALLSSTSYSTTANAAQSLFENAPFKIEAVPGAKTLDRLKEIRKQGDGYPVILGIQEDVEMILDIMETAENSSEEILQQATFVDLEKWKSTRIDSDPDYYQAEMGNWPFAHHPYNAITGHLDPVTQKPYDTVYIGILPVQHSWEVPAYLKVGGWNDCPEAQVHVAFLKKWEEQYGAQIVSVGDIVEFEVTKPPKNKAEAQALAKEHFIYCPDNVHQGTGDLAILADTLLNAKAWFFWWD